jgi:hypothetical protein
LEQLNKDFAAPLVIEVVPPAIDTINPDVRVPCVTVLIVTTLATAPEPFVIVPVKATTGADDVKIVEARTRLAVLMVQVLVLVPAALKTFPPMVPLEIA